MNNKIPSKIDCQNNNLKKLKKLDNLKSNQIQSTLLSHMFGGSTTPFSGDLRRYKKLGLNLFQLSMGIFGMLKNLQISNFPFKFRELKNYQNLFSEYSLERNQFKQLYMQITKPKQQKISGTRSLKVIIKIVMNGSVPFGIIYTWITILKCSELLILMIIVNKRKTEKENRNRNR